jgi:hypothetical protein
MSRWFDDAAKRAARDEIANDSSGMTRRSALKKGAVVAGMAWTAPMLMQSAAVATSVASCDPARICTVNGKSQCCDQANLTACSSSGSGNNAAPKCVAALGETCPSGATKCGTNETSNCAPITGVCGGAGATCSAAAPCAAPLRCVGAGGNAVCTA